MPAKFTAYGVGVYSYFANTPEAIYSDTAIESVKKDGIHFEHLFTAYLNGDAKNPNVESGINHIINDTGDAALSTQKKGLTKGLMEKWPL